MDLKELKYILAIVENGSISKAAASLFMAQSSLSEAVSRLEKELETTLFLRGASGVRLTTAGELFVQNAQEVQLILEKTTREMQELEEGKGGRVQLGVSTFRGSYLLPTVLSEFYRENPNIQVIINEFDSGDLIRSVGKGHMDLALVVGKEGSLQGADSVLKDEVLIQAHKSHPIIEKKREMPHKKGGYYVTSQVAAEYEFLLSSPNTILGKVAQELFGHHPQFEKNSNKTLSAFFATSLASVGLGLALTYGECLNKNDDNVYLSIGEHGYFVDLQLIYPYRAYRSRGTCALAEKIKRFYEKESYPKE